MSPEESEFVDRIGLFMELLGGSRTMGRVYGWLMVCDPPEQSLTALADTLSVSKASVSTVARQLQEGGLIERLPSANRQHRYRVRPGGFTSVLSVQLARMKLGIEAAEFGLAMLDGNRPDQRERLEDFKHFCEFSSQAYHDEMIGLWTEYRNSRGREEHQQQRRGS